jgi:hypothetical protein
MSLPNSDTVHSVTPAAAGASKSAVKTLPTSTNNKSETAGIMDLTFVGRFVEQACFELRRIAEKSDQPYSRALGAICDNLWLAHLVLEHDPRFRFARNIPRRLAERLDDEELPDDLPE